MVLGSGHTYHFYHLIQAFSVVLWVRVTFSGKQTDDVVSLNHLMM